MALKEKSFGFMASCACCAPALSSGSVEVNDGLAAWGFNAADLRNIERDTAIKLIPRLKSA